MFRRRKGQGNTDSSTSLVEYVCPECRGVLRVPHQIVRDFSPGGKEYHKGGETSFVCIKCGGMIPIRRGG